MLTVTIASYEPASSAQLLAALQQTGLVKTVKQWTISSDKLPETGDNLVVEGKYDCPVYKFGSETKNQ